MQRYSYRLSSLRSNASGSRPVRFQARRRARIVLLPLLLWMVTVSMVMPAIARAEDAKGALDMVLIIDTSKSMRGAGGAANIFSRVQDVSRGFLNDLRLQDTFTLISFDSETHVQPTVLLASDTERARLVDQIVALRAEGNWTYTSDALRKGLAEADRLAKQHPEHTQVVLILTDGLNDPPPGSRAAAPALADVTEPYAGKPWYVYQVQLGPEVDKDLAKAIGVFPNGTTIHDNGATNLDALRKRIQEKRAVPKPVELRVDPKELHLILKAVERTETVTASIKLPAGLVSGALRVGLVDPSVFPAELTIDPEIVGNPDGTAGLRVRATARSKVPNAAHTGSLRLVTTPSGGVALAPVEIPLEIRTKLVPPLWPKILLAALGVLIVLGIVLYAVRRVTERRLAGQLEYWPKSRPQEHKRVPDLRAFRSKAVIGSTQIPLAAGTTGAATLTPRRIDGQYHVVVTAAPGKSLSMGSRRLNEIVLYDRDTFTLEDWEFRYRGAVGPRPRH
jgi:hypothetical protein